MNGYILNSSVSCVIKKRGTFHDEHGYFQLFYNYLEEQPYNNIYQNVKQDADYMEVSMQTKELNEQYKNLIYQMNSGKS